MVLGYDNPRPRKWNYDCFKYGFLKALRALNIEGLSLMFYGSYVRGDAIFGRSDIDALLVFPNDVVIDKNEFMQVSEAFKKSQKGNNIPFQVNVSDLRTLKDGRFNAYSPSFKDYFSEEGKVVFGTDYRAEFRYELPTHSEQGALAFNLRKSRQALLFSNWDIERE